MKRLFLLLLVVFALYISLTSVSYAYTLDDVFLYASQLTDITINNTAGSSYNNMYYVCYNLLSSKETQITNMFNQYYSTADTFGVNYYYNNTGIGARIMCYTGDNTYCGHASTSTGDGVYDRCWISGGTFLGSIYVGSAVNGSNSFVERQPNSKADNYSNSLLNSNPPKGFYLVKTGDYSGTGFSKFCINGLIPPYTGPEFTVSTFNNSTIPVHYGSNSDDFYRLQYTTSMRLKDLGNISNFENVYSIVGYFGPYVTDDIIDGSQSTFFYNKYGGTQNGTLVFYEDTGLVQIRTSKLIPNQGYNLNLAYQTEKDGEWIDFADINFYAYYYGSNPSSGDLVSPDLNSTIDIGFVNALDDFFNTDSGDVEQVANSIFQNPFGSGEFFGVGFNYDNYDDWGFGDFVVSIFNAIVNILASYDDVTLNARFFRFNF